MTSRNDPLLSVILATDTLDRVGFVLESLAGQTIAHQMELVLVTLSPNGSAHEQLEERFHSIKFVDVPSMVPLGKARAAGVRAAAAPFVLIIETHVYPDPQLAEKLTAAVSGEWSHAVPGFRNANPDTGLSWVGFLSDYGSWAQTLPPGETDKAPAHNAAFRRSVLLEFGERLEHVLTFGDELYLTLRARGHKSYFEPAAGIQHVNLNRFRPFVRERYLAGALIGGARSTRWSFLRRMVYVVGSPLIPFVTLSRIRKGVRDTARSQSLPRGTFPAIVLGAIVKAAGEMRGYLLGAPESAEEEMTGFEVRKLAFNSGEES